MERGPDTSEVPDTALALQKQPFVPRDQNPEQSNRNHIKDERQEKKKERKGGGGKEENEKEVEEKLEEEQETEEEKELKMENDEEYPEKRLVSKPLLDTLWAMFKLNKCPTIGDSLSLAFTFNMTEKQINQWFFKKRKKFNKEMYKQKYKKKRKRYSAITYLIDYSGVLEKVSN
ncbi:NANOG neighbor homeobox [Pteropus alecto]|uniref:NANOG neighbor homeobox n=1 Tax=Pteropus alecto TaxID=9402 RepID=UPI0007688248|nr:NANOG neighbor homeobox [Pteropus alecto]